MGKVEREGLIFICDKIMLDPDLQPKGGITYCNRSVHRICTFLGYDHFDGLMANGIIEEAETRPEWTSVLPNAAHAAAEEGRICIAGTKGQIHGHVAVVYPGPMLFSSKWNIEVPLVANVGKLVGAMGANYAFRELPAFFLLDKTKWTAGTAGRGLPY